MIDCFLYTILPVCRLRLCRLSPSQFEISPTTVVSSANLMIVFEGVCGDAVICIKGIEEHAALWCAGSEGQAWEEAGTESDCLRAVG